MRAKLRQLGGWIREHAGTTLLILGVLGVGWLGRMAYDGGRSMYQHHNQQHLDTQADLSAIVQLLNYNIQAGKLVRIPPPK